MMQSTKETLPSKTLTKNDHRSVRKFHLDACIIAERERTRSVDEQESCQNDIAKLLHHSNLRSEENHQTLTNADRSWIITHFQNRRRNRKSLHDYLRTNQEIFALQYALNVKHQEIERFESDLRNEERALAKAEKHLTDDSALFDQFLDACNRNATDAAQRADEESQKKEELVNEIKQLQKTLITYHNDRNHLIDTLKQSRRYQRFLWKCAPAEWRVQTETQGTSTLSKRSVILDSNDTATNSSETELFIPSQEDYSLYFIQAQELLDIFTDMEEKSLPLVQKSQQTSETLDQLQTKIEAVHIDQHQQVQHSQEKIDQLELTVQDALERERSCRTVLIEHRNEKNETFIEQMVEAVGTLYQRHILSADAGVSTSHMIEALENRMKSLLHALEQADSRRLAEAEKLRHIAVRTVERQEKLQQEKQSNQLKHQKALLRAMAPPYAKLGRRIMERSRPLQKRKAKIQPAIVDEHEQWIRLLEK